MSSHYMNRSAEASRYSNQLSYKTRVYQALCTNRVRALDALLYDLFQACHENQFGIFKSDPIRYLDSYNPEYPDQEALIESIFEIFCQIHDEFHPFPDVLHRFKEYGAIAPYILRNGESYNPDEVVKKDTILKLSLSLHTSTEDRIKPTNAFTRETLTEAPIQEPYSNEIEEEFQEQQYQATGTDGVDLYGYNEEQNLFANQDQGQVQGHDEYDEYQQQIQSPEASLNHNAVRSTNPTNPINPLQNTGFSNRPAPVNNPKNFSRQRSNHIQENDSFDPNLPISDHLLANKHGQESNSVQSIEQNQTKSEGFGEKLLAKFMPKKTEPVQRAEPEMKDILLNDSLSNFSVNDEQIDVQAFSMEGEVAPEKSTGSVKVYRPSAGTKDQINISRQQAPQEELPNSKWFGDLESQADNTVKGYYGYVKLFGLLAIKKDIYVVSRDDISSTEEQIHPWLRSFSTVTWLTQDGTMVAYY